MGTEIRYRKKEKKKKHMEILYLRLLSNIDNENEHLRTNTEHEKGYYTGVIHRWINDPIHHVTRSYHGHAIYQTQFCPARSPPLPK